ncbi:MAG: phosphoenolpyruvate--protein phosphotransferase [Clostridia bacterium]|nr:phosphoenolpyruvate--protein phosphotransferase [Clostridia bacterium]
MLKGKGISEGIGIGKALVLKKEYIKIEKSKIEDIDIELEKLKVSLNSVIKETQELKDKSNNEQKQILEAYLMILQDETLIQKTKELIQNEKLNCVYAVEQGMNEIITNFRNIPDEYISERANDIEDIKNRIISKLLQIEENDLSEIEPATIIVTKELTTSDTAKINMKNISGIISEIGGTNSHVSIIARNKQIPMIIRVENIVEQIKDGDIVVINGETGDIHINPSIEEMAHYQKLQKQDEEEKQELGKFKNAIAKTKDGFQVEVSSNIGKTSDLEDVLKFGADGIGLFRTEFLFMDSPQMPTEEEQFESYKKIAENMKDKLSIIRTLDAGGDKDIPYLNLEKEDNPFLGYRAIRLCLGNLELFKIQLRAILRASIYGNLAIMFPMISVIDELRQAKQVLEECKKELDEKNIKYNKQIKVGMMIEIPAAAIMAETFAKECDFFSIGTNDLIQYTIAAERGNTKIANLYTKNHPAVIKLIKQTIDAAHKNGIFCGMCGEAASNFQYIPLLIGMGLDEFSMNSSAILQAKKTITELNKKECEKLVEEVLQFSSDKEVEKRLKEFIKA